MTVNEVGVPPPVPGTTDTLILPAPPTTVDMAGVAGAPGPAAGVNRADAFDEAEVPAVFVAVA
ncbi:unannotated protein [freshwater metagenome]|uniref:Unannotated protein n=1 Tax=freshwater metagenome TaxID=449393 RepID=A0A6J7R639_9ZZZZ